MNSAQWYITYNILQLYNRKQVLQKYELGFNRQTRNAITKTEADVCNRERLFK